MMHFVIKLFGGISATLGFVALILGIALLWAGSEALLPRIFVVSGFSSLMSGAILYCFGAIVEHLIAIRRNTEAQLQIFTERLGSR